jgi:hypothetical protein
MLLGGRLLWAAAPSAVGVELPWRLVEDGQAMAARCGTRQECQQSLRQTLKLLDLMAHEAKVTGHVIVMTPSMVLLTYTGGSLPPAYHSSRCEQTEPSMRKGDRPYDP